MEGHRNYTDEAVDEETAHHLVVQYVEQSLLLPIVDSPADFAERVIARLQVAKQSLSWRSLRSECNRQFSVIMYQQCHAYSGSISSRAFDTLSRYLFRDAMVSLMDSELASEAVHNTVTDLYKRLNTYRDPFAFIGYCKKALSHEVNRLRRKAEQHARMEVSFDEASELNDALSYAETLPDDLPPLEELVADNMRRRALWRCLAACTSLSAVTKNCMYWFYGLDTGYDEISRRLKISINALQVRVSRALQHLRSDMEFHACLHSAGINE